MSRAVRIAFALLLLAPLPGCAVSFGLRAQHGIVFYCPGVGNVDTGDEGLRRGLEQRGFRGQVARVTWSVSFNPALDQTVRFIARQGAGRLADYIREYIDRYPGRPVHVVGLSGGTGVAIWALEELHNAPARYKVDQVVLLASSLSRDYDVRRALSRVRGCIYNYYSPSDAVLAGPMKVFGTIDGKFLEDGAGSVGLRVPPGTEGRVVNIGWDERFERLGYYGGHTDATNPDFVREHIAPHLVTPVSGETPRTTHATHLATAPPAAPPD
ncbi:MAG: hypothetical protein AB1716_09540 [Planctomycetota bacterium]